MDACLRYIEEEHYCPHCNQRLSCCHTPPFHVGDGLGWGSEYLFVCLNDECSLFVNSWKRFEDQYGHTASCRYMLLPGEKKGTPMMVGGKDAFTGLVVDPEQMKQQNKRYCQEKEALAKLDTCAEQKDLQPALYLILDEAAAPEGRQRACELLTELNDLACVEPIRNHTFKDTHIEQAANMALSRLLKANFMKECPFCAEIIKARAKVCQYCNKEA